MDLFSAQSGESSRSLELDPALQAELLRIERLERTVAEELQRIRVRKQLVRALLNGDTELPSADNGDDDPAPTVGRPTRGSLLEHRTKSGQIVFTARWQQDGRRQSKVLVRVPIAVAKEGREVAELKLAQMRAQWGTATEQEKKAAEVDA